MFPQLCFLVFDPFSETRGYDDEPYGVEDLDSFGDWAFTIGVPPTATDEFKRYVFAAAKTLRMGNRSVDYMLREYSSRWNLEDPQRARSVAVLSATKSAKTATREAIGRLVNYPAKPGRLGLFAATAALQRLQTTFRALTFTVRHGFTFESAALLRLIVEQLAWSMAIHKRDDEGIFDVRPQTTLRHLTSVIPEAGKLYGVLSEHAHIHPDETRRYIEFASGMPMIRMHFRDRNDADVLRLLVVADYYIVTCEVVGAELPLPRFSTLSTDQHFSARDDRPFLAVIRRHEQALAALEQDPTAAA